ncbi:hypothetical protein BELL_0554g00060 [Botrytis elliptica]|uniref:AA1-like domain-containing protein n=1 Tax=Botrytis elliptica TaxID=278938 RepID=A0A4Z1JEB6_9HELO|nr:hypothetical protein EAE99_003638 [Botrytis elliptica]TGO71594.1 hypothetical protein BELL_0554g00060 [Botrytis elliptica]
MQFKPRRARIFSPFIILLTISSIFPPLALATNYPRKGENHKWPDVSQDLPIQPQTCNTTSMTTGQCTLTNLMAVPVSIGKTRNQRSSLIIYDSKCNEIGRQDDVIQNDKDIAIHSTLPEMVTIRESEMGAGKFITFKYSSHTGTKDDFLCYSTGWDAHYQQIKACSAPFNCTAAADSAATVNSLDLGVLLIGVLALVVAVTS